LPPEALFSCLSQIIEILLTFLACLYHTKQR